MTPSQTALSESENDMQRVPPYQQIVATISERIANGTYAPGSKLPAEAQFSAEFGVSFMTLRKALAVLADQGLVYAEKGRGTYIRAISLNDATFRLEQLDSSWIDDSVEVKLLGVSTTKATPHIAERLGVTEDTRVVCLRRLILKDSHPAMYHLEYVIFDPHQPLVESQLQLTTLNGVLQAARGGGFLRGKVKLTALNLDDEAAAILGVPVGSAALSLEHVFEDADHGPVSWGRFLLRADLFRLTAELGLA